MIKPKGPATWDKPIHKYLGWNTPEGLAEWARIRECILTPGKIKDI